MSGAKKSAGTGATSLEQKTIQLRHPGCLWLLATKLHALLFGWVAVYFLVRSVRSHGGL